jgi:hypothetical protein
MPDIFDLLLHWWKQIGVLILITVGVTAVAVYTMPKQYLGVATALPAATYTSDKGAVFSQNLQSLYSSLGTTDDLDMILGTAHLDTIYSSVADKLNLADYYAISKSDNEAVKKAGSILKGKTRAIKSDYGELKIKVWDADRNQAAAMANAVMEKIQQVQRDVIAANNSLMLEKIKEEHTNKQHEYEQLQDSLSHISREKNVARMQVLNVKMNSTLEQIHEYEKLLSEYELMMKAKPEALVVVEKASPSLWPDKPKPKETILVAAVLSFFFGLLAALVLERRKLAKK